MRRELVQRVGLVCPVCILSDAGAGRLALDVETEEDGDVLSGSFSCPSCPRRYPILDGVAVLDPEPLRSTYDRAEFLQAYLWTHYADLSPELIAEMGRLAEGGAGDYFSRLAGVARGPIALDLGCNVGRTTFDLAAGAEFVLGVERSFEAVKRAREIARTRRVAFHLKDEGDRGRYVDLDASAVVRPNVEFVCGDAAALPLGPEAASTVVAGNLLDRVEDPGQFLERVDRVLRPGGVLALTAPFTWREASTPRDRWLGDARRSARETLVAWFTEHGYRIDEVDDLDLVIRNHRRFFEWVRPLLVRGAKSD